MKGITRLPLGVRSPLIFERFGFVRPNVVVFLFVVPRRDRLLVVPGKVLWRAARPGARVALAPPAPPPLSGGCGGQDRGPEIKGQERQGSAPDSPPTPKPSP